MKCLHCGYESNEDFIYCTNCGTAVSDAPAVSLNPTVDKVLAVLKDKLFLVICILMSASSALAVACGSLPVINILTTIFLWLTYSQAAKNYADPNHLRRISGTVYATYVVNNVLAIMLMVCGAIIAFAFALIADTTELLDIIEFELNNADLDLGALGLPEEILSIIGWAFGFVFVLAGVLILVFNLLGMRKIHRFAKSVYQGILTQNPEFEKPQAVRNWLIFFAVCTCISTLSSLTADFIAALSNGCLAATEIIAVIMINKYFLASEN